MHSGIGKLTLEERRQVYAMFRSRVKAGSDGALNVSGVSRGDLCAYESESASRRRCRRCSSPSRFWRCWRRCTPECHATSSCPWYGSLCPNPLGCSPRNCRKQARCGDVIVPRGTSASGVTRIYCKASPGQTLTTSGVSFLGGPVRCLRANSLRRRRS